MKIQLRRDTAANWVNVNPILSSGEIGVDLTTDNIKIGDGITTWNSLGYFSEGLDAEGVIIVAKTGGNFTNIKAALDSIVDNDSTHRYVVLVAPGIYIEDNPIQAKEYVSLKATGDLQTTRIIALNADADLITMANLFTIEGFALWGVSGATNYALNVSTASNGSITRCVFGECTNAILVNHIDAKLTINDCAILNPTVTMVTGALCTAGILDTFAWHANYGTIGTMIKITGANASGILDYVNTPLATVTTAIHIGDGADVTITNAQLYNMATGIEVEGTTHLHINNSTIVNATVDGFRVNDVGADARVSAQGVIIENPARYAANLLSSTCVLSGNVQLEINKLNFATGARMFGTVIDIQEDDEGFNVIGELHVGLPERGTESVFGEGDSYTRGMLVYTETDAAAFVDVSEAAASASGSSVTFTDITTNSAIYLASSLQNADGYLEHFGFKAKTLTAAVPGAGSIVIEYWNNSSWVEVNGMEIHSSEGYYPHAKNYLEMVSSHQTRYSHQLVKDNWTANDPMSLGTNYYWIRLRIASPITTAPIIEQFKLHTNRFEVNNDGWLEYFGKARPIGRLGWEFGVLEKAGGAGDDRDLYLGDELDVGMKKNRFDNGKIARVGFNTVLPMDLDTSSPITFSWNIIAEGTGTADVDWILRWGYSKDGDNVYPESGHPDPASLQIYSVSLPAPGTDTSKWYSTTLDVSEMVSRREGGYPDTLWFTISRDGIADDYASTISIIGISANYIKWCEGGHI